MGTAMVSAWTTSRADSTTNDRSFSRSSSETCFSPSLSSSDSSSCRRSITCPPCPAAPSWAGARASVAKGKVFTRRTRLEGDVVIGSLDVEVIGADSLDLRIDDEIVRHGNGHGVDAYLADGE